MAARRTALAADSTILPGRGRTPSRMVGEAERVGLKDKNASRKVVGIRMTAAQEAAVRDACAKDGGGKTFGIFAAELLMDAIASRSRAVSMIMQPQAGANSAKVEEKLAALAQHQKNIKAQVDATAATSAALAEGIGAVLERMEELGAQMAAATRSVEEASRRKPPKGQDLFTEKHV